MRISVIICTYGRAAVLSNLLESLSDQTFRDFETLIIDGNEAPSLARSTVWKFRQQQGINLQVDLIPSPKGLTRQRNVGLDHATGDIVCFLDDDVTLPEDFLSRVVEIFDRPELQDVGGITGYDVLNYPAPITLRWRLRLALGVIPRLGPGGVDRLGRGIPLSFLQPFTGYKEIGLLHGFCMIYRRRALGNLRFDELIPTYGGEDRDFSMQVGWKWRLLICGDLILQHHSSPDGRDTELARNFQSAFGSGRRFAKYSSGALDFLILIVTFLGDSAIDAANLLSRPTRMNLKTLFVRIHGFFAGLGSDIAAERQSPAIRNINSPEPERDTISSNP